LRRDRWGGLSFFVYPARESRWILSAITIRDTRI
jgi:hypothetical protein